MQIYDKIDELEPVDQKAETFRPVQALYYWPLAFGLLCLLLILLTDLLRRRTQGGN
jgi:Ca-activated chloride channel family protein